MIKLKQDLWFSSCIWETSLDTINNESLIQFVKQIKTINEGHQKNLDQGGWQCFDFVKNDRSYIQLVNTINIEIQNAHESMGYNSNLQSSIQSSWINVNDKYSYNLKHTHPRSLFSGVYYVQVPEGNSGDIVFYRENYMLNYIPPYIVKDWNNINSSTISIKPKVGMLLIFPSWLEHSVTTNLTNQDRISISFNTTFY
jgi:uncharacterized protein (TIGR02466 family)